MAKRERIDLMVVRLNHGNWPDTAVEVEVKGKMEHAQEISEACTALSAMGFQVVKTFGRQKYVDNG